MNLPYGPFARLVCARAGCGLPVLRTARAIYCSKRCAGNVSERLSNARARDGIAPVKRAKPHRQWHEGDRAGAWVLVRRGDMGAWVARCTGCGVVKTVNASSVAANGSPCQPCVGKARMLPRLCRSCGTTDPTRFKIATECVPCARLAAPSRNGRCGCGRAVRRHSDCPCGRRADTIAGRILRAVAALHAVGFAPTRGLLREIVGERYHDPLRDLVARGVVTLQLDDAEPVRPKRPAIDWRAIADAWRETREPFSRIARRLGVDPSTAGTHLRALGCVVARGRPRIHERRETVPRPRRGSDYVPAPTIKRDRSGARPRRTEPVDWDAVVAFYRATPCPLRQVAARFGTDAGTVSRWFRVLGVALHTPEPISTENPA